ncbi:MAG: 30S ribosomal protein S8 [bacterium]|nr:30S ribosomal protein S8 [bacterium]
MNYPIGDMLIRIKNASQARHVSVEVPFSGFGERMAKFLVQEGYLGEVQVEGDGKNRKIKMGLKYLGKNAMVNRVKQISKPGLRKYYKTKDLNGFRQSSDSLVILSTPQGLTTLKEARKKKVGGELLFEIW